VSDIDRRRHEGERRAVIPYDNTYRIYQIERSSSPAEVQSADAQAARLACAISSLFRGMVQPARAIRRPAATVVPGLPRRRDQVACGGGQS
jgi:hypothetical protein